MKDQSPFKAGDTVIYQPSTRGRGLVIMTDLAALKPGSVYKISRVDKDVYIVLEGFENATGGGVHWTEFRKANE